MKTITEKYEEKISFSLSSYDRLIITGHLPDISYAKGMTAYLNKIGVKIFDYAHFAEPYRGKIRQHIESKSKASGVPIEFIGKSKIRKESLVSEKLKTRGTGLGIVCILSAMEGCNTYKPWHDKNTGKTFLKSDKSQCLHYYVYFIDKDLGFGYIRIPTWCPFRLQIYINGHNLLAKELDKANIGYTMIDNAFDSIANPEVAQKLSDGLDVKKIHRAFDRLAWEYCPVYKDLNLRYQWNVMQAEYAMDIVFKHQQDLQEIYGELVATAIHTVKPDNISSFWGQKLSPRYQGEVGNNYNVRIEGSRIKHIKGSNSIKMYDKFHKILRIETTTNNISDFKHYREVVHRDGTKSYQDAPFKKNIYSLSDLSGLLKAVNKRYLEFISVFDNKEVGRKNLMKISESKTQNNRNYKGFNFFCEKDLHPLLTILRAEFYISGFRNKDLKSFLNLSSSQISRLIKRLRIHGLIKRVGKSYKYYLTVLGKNTIIMAQKIKEIVLVPAYDCL
ncbi:MAG: MarR family transcriptional regulator [Bacteroidales bacterium]|jgi:predicted transcriptional regulator|nr:MarR family transcriptional regulator [Bacteroidales bacterium]